MSVFSTIRLLFVLFPGRGAGRCSSFDKACAVSPERHDADVTKRRRVGVTYSGRLQNIAFVFFMPLNDKTNPCISYTNKIEI